MPLFDFDAGELQMAELLLARLIAKLQSGLDPELA